MVTVDLYYTDLSDKSLRANVIPSKSVGGKDVVLYPSVSKCFGARDTLKTEHIMPVDSIEHYLLRESMVVGVTQLNGVPFLIEQGYIQEVKTTKHFTVLKDIPSQFINRFILCVTDFMYTVNGELVLKYLISPVDSAKSSWFLRLSDSQRAERDVDGAINNMLKRNKSAFNPLAIYHLADGYTLHVIVWSFTVGSLVAVTNPTGYKQYFVTKQPIGDYGFDLNGVHYSPQQLHPQNYSTY